MENVESRFVNDRILLDKAAGYRENASQLAMEAFKVEMIH